MPNVLEELEQIAGENGDQPAVEIELPAVSSADITVDQLVFHGTHGYGEVTAVDGNAVTFRERKDPAVTRTVAAQDLITKSQAEVGLKTTWFAGGAKAWRRAQGKWASLTKNLCRYGEWKEVLEKYDLNRSSMDDLIRRFEEEATWEAQDAALAAANLPDSGNLNPTAPVESSQSSVYAVTSAPKVNERTPDSENDERQKNIQAEISKRQGIEPTHHKTILYLQRRNCDPEKLALYHAVTTCLFFPRP